LKTIESIDKSLAELSPKLATARFSERIEVVKQIDAVLDERLVLMNSGLQKSKKHE